MYVYIDQSGKLKLGEADDFKSFSFVSGAFDQLADPEAVRLEAGHAWISISRLFQCHPHAGSSEWVKDAEGMIAFAKKHGWVDPDGDYVRAHIERDE